MQDYSDIDVESGGICRSKVRIRRRCFSEFEARFMDEASKVKSAVGKRSRCEQQEVTGRRD